MSDQQVNEGAQVQESTQTQEANTPEQKGPTLTDVEALQKALDKTRAEAAAARAEKSELKAAADKWAEYEEAQKSELQKAYEAREAVEAQLEKERTEAIKARTALTYGLSAEDLDLLGAGDEATLQARAERIRALHQAAAVTPPPTNLPQGNPVPGTAPAQPVPTGPAFPASWANL